MSSIVAHFAVPACVVVACGGVDHVGIRSLDGGAVQGSEAGNGVGAIGGSDAGGGRSAVGGGNSSGGATGIGGIGGSGGAGSSGSSTLDAGGEGQVVGADSGGGFADAGGQCGLCPQGQQCDPKLGCVTCIVDSDCPASARVCLMGSCVQCKTNADCGGTTPSCWPDSHTCHAPCASNQQCGDGNTRICDVTTEACVGCLSAADCPTSMSVCDPRTRQCAQCSTSSDCAGTSTPACLRNRCAQCATSADCPSATPYCAFGGDSPGQCLECLQNAQCPPTAPRCSGGTCGKPGG